MLVPVLVTNYHVLTNSLGNLLSHISVKMLFMSLLHILACVDEQFRKLPPLPIDETHLDAVRGLIQLRGFNQCINKKSSLKRYSYV